MHVEHTGKRLTALLASAMIAITLVLSGCGGAANSSNNPPENATDATDAAQATDATDATGAALPEEPFGKPWLVSILQGNIPESAPSAKDDLYLSLDYDLIKEHQGESWINATAYTNELKTKTLDAIGQKDESNHDVAQFRILHDQAADWDTLAKTGLSEVQPYLDRIDAAKSIEELNAVLCAKDFPFSPFVTATLGVTDKREKTDVSIYPNFLYFDLLFEGAKYYDGANTEEGDKLLQQMALTSRMYITQDLMLLGKTEEEAIELTKTLLDFEEAYGKDADYNARYVKADYGAYSQAFNESIFTLDELCALCPNIPLREILKNMGKDGAENYSAMSSKWLSSLNNAWTEENLDTIKLMAKAKVLAETRPYRDPKPYNDALQDLGQAVDADTFAWNACNSLDTFAQPICKVYVNDVLGENARQRITKIAEDAIADYRVLVGSTSWLSAESQAKVIEKLDNLTVNMLEPEDGWFDYSGLDLKMTDEGGTLLSNYLLCKQYRYDREAERIGKPASGCTTWYFVNPSMPNAFYNAQDNSINLVPGFLNSMNYSDDMDDSALLGAVGWTIGHEISHGFDYMGTQTDAYGRGNSLFSDADKDAFVAKCALVADYYGTVELENGEKYDGQLVVVEAAADLSGMQVMLDLLGKADSPNYESFFAKGAEMYAQTVPALVYPQLKADTHPLSYLRVNVNAQMFEPFYNTYGVSEGDGMYLAPDKRIAIWGANA